MTPMSLFLNLAPSQTISFLNNFGSGATVDLDPDLDGNYFRIGIRLRFGK
jgi:hypothetical protein